MTSDPFLILVLVLTIVIGILGILFLSNANSDGKTSTAAEHCRSDDNTRLRGNLQAVLLREIWSNHWLGFGLLRCF